MISPSLVGLLRRRRQCYLAMAYIPNEKVNFPQPASSVCKDLLCVCAWHGITFFACAAEHCCCRQQLHMRVQVYVCDHPAAPDRVPASWGPTIQKITRTNKLLLEGIAAGRQTQDISLATENNAYWITFNGTSILRTQWSILSISVS